MKSENSFIIRLEEVKSLLDKSGLLKHAIMKHDRKRTVISRHIENVKQFKEFVDEVLLKNEYDFLLCDDSFFQFDRICSGEKIVYKYVFIQNPGIRIPFDEYCFKNEIDLEDENIDYYKEIYDDDETEDTYKMLQFPLYLRYDVDEKGYVPNLHSYAHLHIGVVEDVRLSVSKILTPSTFVNLVLKMIYPDNWKNILSESKTNPDIYNFKRLCDDIPLNLWQSCEKKDIYLT